MADSRCRAKRLDLGPLLIRRACFPFEMASSITSTALATAATCLLDQEAELQSAGQRVCEELYRTVPGVADRGGRAQLIGLRRILHKSLEPVPQQLLESALASPVLPSALKHSLAQHANHRLHFASERRHFEQLYKDAIGRERAELFLATADESFRKALYVATPTTLAALDRLACLTPKRHRRLEETLHSYLMRAVGRATPNGAWSGVTMQGQNEDESRVIFSVRLEPFAAALNAISDREPWRSYIPFRVNPSLRRDNSGGFEYFHNREWKRFQSLDCRIQDQLNALIGKTQVSPDGVYAAKELVGLGLLRPNLQLPRIYSDPWSALDEIVPLLPDSERGTWRHSLRMLRKVAEQLGAEYDALTLQALQSGMNSARCLVNLLLARYEVNRIPESQHVFLVDRRMALSTPLPKNLEPRVSRAIRSYWSFDRYGMGESTAGRERRSLFGKLPDEGICLEDLVARNCSGPWPVDDMAYVWRWHSELAPVNHKRQHALSGKPPSSPVPPGSGLMRIDADGRLRLGSITPDPCLFYSRFSALFRGSAHDDAFCEWYAAGIQNAESAFPELIFADVAFSSAGNMNAAARRNMTGRVLDTSGETLRIYSDETEWPKLRAAAQTPVIVPRVHSAAVPDESDARAHTVCQLSFLIGRPNFLRPLPRFEEEYECWQHLPRLVLGDVIISPERWTPGQELIDALRLSSNSERYLAWRRYARSAALPDLVYVSSAGADSELLLDSASALAIDLLGRRLAKRGGPLLIQEAWPAPVTSWLRDERGFHYATELAVAWHGDPEFWCQYLGSTAL
jgi:Lantibiotic dehydratase, N terminus